MNRTRAKELAPIIQAFADGKAIEWFNLDSKKQRWEAATTPTWADDILYRIKPEPKYVPFTFEDNELFRDKWVKYKGMGYDLNRIVRVRQDSLYIENLATPILYDAFLDVFEFEDCSPCGKLTED